MIKLALIIVLLAHIPAKAVILILYFPTFGSNRKELYNSTKKTLYAYMKLVGYYRL